MGGIRVGCDRCAVRGESEHILFIVQMKRDTGSRYEGGE